MDIYERPGDAARTFGAFAVIIGLVIAVLGLLTDTLPTRAYVVAGLLVFTGCAADRGGHQTRPRGEDAPAAVGPRVSAVPRRG